MCQFRRSLTSKNSNLKKYNKLRKNQSQYPNLKKYRSILRCRGRRRNRKRSNRRKKIVIYFMMYSAKDANRDPSKIYSINVEGVRSWIFANCVLRKPRIRSYIHLLKLGILRQLRSMWESISNNLLSNKRKRRCHNLRKTKSSNTKQKKRGSSW